MTPTEMILADAVAASIRVVVHEAEAGGYWVEFPAFPSVYAEGETIDHARRDAQTILARYLELREARHADDSAARPGWSDDAGPIPSIPAGSDGLGVRMPIPARVKAARSAADARRQRVLNSLPDDPPGTDEALLEALGVALPDRP